VHKATAHLYGEGSSGDIEASDRNKPNIIGFPNGITIYQGGNYEQTQRQAIPYDWFKR
jgi:hypothetical protein